MAVARYHAGPEHIRRKIRYVRRGIANLVATG